jgi:hypothetical protein
LLFVVGAIRHSGWSDVPALPRKPTGSPRRECKERKAYCCLHAAVGEPEARRGTGSGDHRIGELGIFGGQLAQPFRHSEIGEVELVAALTKIDSMQKDTASDPTSFGENVSVPHR